MKRRLTKAETEYVWLHLRHHFEIGTDIHRCIEYKMDGDDIAGSEDNDDQPLICFLTSDQDVSTNPFFDNRENLVLFPCSTDKTAYTIQGTKLVFHHDYLKTIFFFISGYQEWKSGDLDSFGRFEYKNSIQSGFDLPPLPFVNSIIDLIGEGLSEYCNYHSFPFKKRSLFGRGIFLLSHDIDHIRQYRLSYFKYKLKEIAGVVRNHKYSKFQLIDQFRHGLVSALRGRQDPAWSFEFLHEVNRQYGSKSTYFFLNQEGNRDGSFDLDTDTVRSLVQKIDEWGDEIGVHGTMRSSESFDSAAKIFDDVKKISPQKIYGNRQHWLKYQFPTTTRIHQSMGYHYDATLGFNDRAGFRHGYCFPFKLWDFDHQKPFEVWEVPLCVMDVTLLSYMDLSIEECAPEIEDWINRVRQYRGILSILWHNTTLNEYEIPGVKDEYRKIIEMSNSQFDSWTHSEVMEHLEKP